MEKSAFTAMCAVAIMLCGCQNQDADINSNLLSDKVNVAFTIDTPTDFASRAVGQGDQATNLTIAIFDEFGQFLTQEDRDGVFATGKTQTVNVQLVKKTKYIVAFWVDAYPSSATNPAYKVIDGVLHANYTGALANDDCRDAFYSAKEIEVADNNITCSISLIRPMAQINLATSDYEEAKALGKNITATALTIKGCIYSQMNLANGAVMGSPAEVTFGLNTLPGFVTAPAKLGDYDWLAMAYALVDANGGTTSEIILTTDDPTMTSLTYTSAVPVKRNFRTNICGKLLTNSSEWSIDLDD